MRDQSYVVCISNDDYPASLEVRKIYEVIADPEAERLRQIRIVDESGEDYLYPQEHFISIELPREIRAAFRQAS